MDNSLLHAFGHYPADKIEQLITFTLSHTRLYLAESDGERAPLLKWRRAVPGGIPGQPPFVLLYNAVESSHRLQWLRE